MTALPDQLNAMTVHDAATSIGVELRGDDLQPYCCGALMTVREGVLGADYASCEQCGNLIVRVDSPHTNGGYSLTDEALDELGDRTWVARHRLPEESM